MAEDNLSDVHEIYFDQNQQLSMLNSDKLPETVAAPARVVFSVKIYCNSFDKRKTCHVYGNVKIFDANDKTYVLYCRGRDESQTLTQEHDTLSLSMPKKCAVSRKWRSMKIEVMDKFDDSVIVKGNFCFDDVIKLVDYDKVNIRRVDGVGGHATVSYAAFSTAVLAKVDIILVNKDRLPCFTDVHGTVVALYGNTYGKKFPGITLFKKLSDQHKTPIKLSETPIKESETSMVLSREVVVVPAYSFLRIDVELSDYANNEKLVDTKLYFLASHGLYSDPYIKGVGCVIQVKVSWFHPYQVKIPVEKLPPMNPRKFEPYGFELAEVFSVMIGHDGTSESKICGSIEIQDADEEHVVFYRNEVNPQTLSASMGTIPIQSPKQCFYAPDDLGITLDLWDDKRRLFIKGQIPWDGYYIPCHTGWFDRRICSVSRGSHGYAAVFYTIFSLAVQANVQATFVFKGLSNDASHRVHGTIVTRYNNEHYETEYEKEYFQSVLFKKPLENSVALSSSLCSLPLLKSVVAVPTKASLIVEVDLCASSFANEFPEEHLTGSREFDIVPDMCRVLMIDSKNYHIEISVGWSKLFQLYK